MTRAPQEVRSRIDFDANATYSSGATLRDDIQSLLPRLANPSAMHRAGQGARAVVESARDSVRRLIGAGSRDQVIFTSGATEGNNTVIANAVRRRPSGAIVSTAVEHPCILAPLARLGRSNPVVLVQPQSDGSIGACDVIDMVDENTSLVSVMMANNEVGTLYSIREIAEGVRSRNSQTLVHTDAAQMIGKGEVSFAQLGVDMMTVSAHKIGGLCGVGALIVKEGVSCESYILGGAQEGKIRGGTENVLGIGVFGLVAERVAASVSERSSAMRSVRDYFESCVTQLIPQAEINGRGSVRLPNTTSLYIPGSRADDLVVALDLKGIMVSSGAACSSGKREPSHVLLAMGQDKARAQATLRISVRADSTVVEAEWVARALAEIVRARSVDHGSREQ